MQLGELSAERQALEGARWAPGTEATLQVLRDLEKRLPCPRERWEARPERFELDEELFLQCVRSSRRGAAGGPSGMTADHLQPILESGRDAAALTSFAARWHKGGVVGSIGGPARIEHKGWL